MNKSKKILFVLVSVIVLFFSFNNYFLVKSFENKELPRKENALLTEDNSAMEDSYSDKLIKWNELGLKSNHDETIHVDYSFYKNTQKIVSQADSFKYYKNTYKVEENDLLEFNISANSPNLFIMEFDFYSLTSDIYPLNINIKINDKFQYKELSTLELNTLWNYSNVSNLDRYGNEVVPTQIQKNTWITQEIYDNRYFSKNPLLVFIDSKETNFKISIENGSFLLGEIKFKPLKTTISYDDYISNYSHDKEYKYLEKYEAEKIDYKNNSSIRPSSSKDSSVTPFALIYNKMNVINSDILKNAGSKITYQISVPKKGLYNITFKARQDISKNKKSFYKLYINHLIPFEEAKNIAFEYSSKWKNYTIQNDDKENYYFYLEEGVNLLTLEPTSFNISEYYNKIDKMVVEMNNLALDIRKMTGNNADPNRDWDLETFIPGITDKFVNWKNSLETIYDDLKTLYSTKKNTLEMENIKTSIAKINQILKDIDKLPYKLSLFTEGSGCVTQLLGSVLEELVLSPLSLDCFYIHSESKIPKPSKNFFVSSWYSIKRFFMSFFVNPYDKKLEEGEVNIWVNKSRQYVDVMQSLTDSVFTKNEDIKIKFSIMPDENKLILANASNTQPDVALGIHSFLPYQLAIRNAVYDLRNFDDYVDVIENFEDASLIPFVYEQGLYALPDVQNFQVMFYRKDLLEKLSIPVPDTWSDVVNILPELQRYGMNFYVPIANSNSFKTFDVILPYLMQRNASLFTNNGLNVDLSSNEIFEGLEFMTDLFNIYSLPNNINSFYNHFRNGLLPIGIGDYNTYIQLLHAAPEIKGLWDIALIPGVKDEKTGVVNRQSPGLSQGITMFEKSKNKENAWEFIKWWTSTETQVLYEQSLLTTYGKEYMYNSANINAFKLSNFDKKHKEVILEQWSNLNNISLVPAYYMIERELSNLWNKVVLSNVSLRDAIDLASVTIEREMMRKNIEFNYLDKKGDYLKDYPICTIDTIKGWKLDDRKD